MLDLCQLPCLTFWEYKIKTPHASNGNLELNYNSTPCLTSIYPNKMRNIHLLITMTEY